MKLHLNTADGQNMITAHGKGQVSINGLAIGHSLIVMPDRLISPWEVRQAEAVSIDDFAVLLELKPELIVFGSGPTFRFPDPHIGAAFAAQRIGFDVMDTAAACRTYNVLMSEGRRVAAALLIYK